MTHVRTLRRTLFGAALSFAFGGAAVALSPDQPNKPPPRLPANAAESNRIPAGVDTGSPATSDTLPLGTPVPPVSGADRSDVNKRSAAGRAAARPSLVGAPSTARTSDRVPAGPATLGASSDPLDPAAAATAGERKTAPRSRRAASAAR